MAGNNYTNTFGGQNVSPANLSYIAYTIAEDLHLTWAFEAVEGDNVTASKIDIVATVANVSVMMPHANQVTVGQDVMFANVGNQPYVVTDHDETQICVVAPGEEWFVYLIDNTTPDGVWRSVQFGASTSGPAASELAGAGLRAALTKLDQNLKTTHLLADYPVTDGDRALVLQNDGGAIALTLPSAPDVTNGWFFYVINAGTGSITLQPIGGQLIDGAVNKQIAPSESLIVLSDGVNFHTIGYGRSLVTTVTGASINAAGAGVLTLSDTQIKAQIQDYSGTLTGDRLVDYGTGVGYWFVWNKTDPLTPHKLIARTTAIDTGVIIPQGALPDGTFTILRSNGTSMEIAFSDAGGSVTLVETATGELVGGPITSTGTLGLANTDVVPGTYGNAGPPVKMPGFQVDQKGRILAAAELTLGSSAGIDVGTGPGKIPVLDAGGNIPSLNGGMQPGDIQFSIALTKPGFVFANGTTIGSATSGASQRAAPDTVNLFAVIWALSNSLFPIYTSAGVLSTRGVDATTDFNNNKRITVPDLRGTGVAGLDNAGGAATADRLSAIMNSLVMGTSGGAQNAVIANNNLPLHSHPNALNNGAATVNDPGHTHTLPFPIDRAGAGNLGGVGTGNPINFDPGGAPQPTGLAGSGISVVSNVTIVNANGPAGSTNAALPTTPPTMVMNPFLKL